MTSPVLLVESSPSELAKLRRCVEGLDVEVLCAASGNEALEVVADRDLAFVVMALSLPDVSGIEVTRLIHGDRGKQHIPVVLVATPERMDAVLYSAYEAGALDVIERPYKQGLLIAKARVYLDLHRSRRRVETQQAELLRSNAEFRSFAHAAAHDLREPLRAIGGYAGLLQRSTDASERAAVPGKIRSSLDRMDKMLVGMLQYAETEQAHASVSPVDLSEVVEAAVESLWQLRTRVNGRVEVGPLPVLQGNADQFGRLFQNLIANALKYHRLGVPPRVSVQCEVEDGFARIGVSDNGTGFDPALVEEIFRPFRRLTSSAEGSGIGMATARKVVERHGGTLGATSKLGQGSEFVVRLPMRTQEITDYQARRVASGAQPGSLVSEQRGHVAAPVSPEQRPCVLVVDDSEADRELAVYALKRGYEIVTADSAERALFLMDTRVRAVVTDYNMPGRDGVWLLEQLTSQHPEVSRILVSGYPDERCQEAHARGYAQALAEKPVSRADLDGLLGRGEGAGRAR